jgi:polar amino acid transport system substrate-binding protein
MRSRIHADRSDAGDRGGLHAGVRPFGLHLSPAGGITIRNAADTDRPGVRIATVRGHASTAALLRIVKQAAPVYADSYEGAIGLLRNGSADAFASIREILLQYAVQLPGSQVLDDSYQANFAGIAVAKGNPGRLAYLSQFLDDMKRSGLLQRIIDGTELRGIEIVVPQASH